MELIAPLGFAYTFYTSPLSYYPVGLPSLTSPQSILAICFLIHYSNRALIGPLRTPSRSKSHIIVPLSAVLFNTINGCLMGSYLSSPYGRIFLSPGFTFGRTSFWVGLALWAIGFAGNIIHDEILLDIRRKAKVKGKSKAEESESEDEDGQSGDVNNGGTKLSKQKESRKQEKGEHYAIPQGLLYSYVSYPNYFCEWIEWFGFALAAAPLPFALPLISSPADLVALVPSTLSTILAVFSPRTITWIIQNITTPPYLWAPDLAPPYIFLLAEVLLMFPRAWNGHKWYKERFGERYPRDRKVVVPWLL